MNLDWHAFAACADMGWETFFPVGAGPGTRDTRAAKRVCYQCPVINDCLEWALVNYADDGIWGGLDEDERRRLRRGRGIRQPQSEHGTEARYAAHLRRKERPCDACREAHKVYVSERRQEAS